MRPDDTNENYIQLEYAAGTGTGSTGSSSRILKTWDSRVWNMNVPIYTFTYNTDTIPHLTSITCAVTPAESYTLVYQQNRPLYSPFEQMCTGISCSRRCTTTGI